MRRLQMERAHNEMGGLRILCAIGLALCAWLSVSPARAAIDVSRDLAAVQRYLDNWEIDEAAKVAAELNAALPDVPPVQAVVGAVKFHQGDYEGALRLMRRAAEGGVVSPLLPLAESTWEETKGFIARESEHFVVRTPPGKDELLADIALWALEKSYEEVSTAFDYRPQHKIPVDILHDAKGLAEVSSLTVDEIQTSGTIALCKYNRLMVTSPKALARGYSWLDTLSHEFVHLVISEKSANTVPIWLHEGLAKYSESLWRGQPGLAMDASSENLLADAVKKNKLITFEQMHPSMAKLPSQQDTALAFAEVFTVIEYMHRTYREKDSSAFSSTNALLRQLRTGKEMDAALDAAVGTDLRGLQKGWMRYLKRRQFRLQPGAKPKRLKFVANARRGTSNSDENEEDAALEEAQGKKGRRFVRLGNLLRRRGRVRAAALEYEKAVARIPYVLPTLMNRLAGIQLELGAVDKAKSYLDKTVVAAPDDPQTHILLGRIALREERFEDARRHYERATWENPFNPEIHAALYRVGERTDDAKLRASAKRALGLISGHAKANPDGDAPWRLSKDESFGALSVDASPWGEVFIDGMSTGMTTPLVDLRIRPGVYQVRVEDQSEGLLATERVEISENEGARVNLALERLSPQAREKLYSLENPIRELADRPDPKDAGTAADSGQSDE